MSDFQKGFLVGWFLGWIVFSFTSCATTRPNSHTPEIVYTKVRGDGVVIYSVKEHAE